MSKRWRWLLTLCYPALWLNALTAFIYALVWCRARSWRWQEGVLTFVAQREMIGHPGGQGWSWIVGFKSDGARGIDHLRVHENCHVVQETIFAALGLIAGVVLWALTGALKWALLVGLTSGGAAFMIAYGGFFFAVFAANGFKDWHDAYLKIPFEKQAYAKQDAYRYASVERRSTIWGNS